LGWLGSIIKIQRFEWPIDLSEVENLAKQKRALFVKLEPEIRIQNREYRIENKLYKAGFKKDSWPLVPPTTRILDLCLSEDELFKQFSENCRRNIRKAQELKLKVKNGGDEWFYDNWKKTAKRKKLYIPRWNNFQIMRLTFRDNMKIVNIVNKDGEWLAGVVVLISENDSYRPAVDSRSKRGRAYYYFATANEEGKKLRAPYLAAWEGIKLVKNAGCDSWDWEGVADERFRDTNTKAWKGFGEFKAKFGGEESRYIGSFIKYYGWGRVLQLLEIINFR
jgi:lipid II:glycine glycyltransferase (peptidoglycan interpeptide bridge formation enzyme)